MNCAISACFSRRAPCPSTGRHDLALELIADINSHEAIRLRSDILWAARRWREAGEQIELLYGDALAGIRAAQLIPSGPTSCVRRSAMHLAKKQSALRGFARNTRPRFADGPDRRAFDVVTAPIGTSGAEFQDIAKKVASVDTLDAFLRDLRARYPEASAVSPPGTPGEGAAAPSATPGQKSASANAPQAVPAGKEAATNGKNVRVIAVAAQRAGRRAGQARQGADRLHSAPAEGSRPRLLNGCPVGGYPPP